MSLAGDPPFFSRGKLFGFAPKNVIRRVMADVESHRATREVGQQDQMEDLLATLWRVLACFVVTRRGDGIFQNQKHAKCETGNSRSPRANKSRRTLLEGINRNARTECRPV